MTVGELRELLTQYPDDLVVYSTDDAYGGPDCELEATDLELHEGRELIDGVARGQCLLIRF